MRRLALFLALVPIAPAAARAPVNPPGTEQCIPSQIGSGENVRLIGKDRLYFPEGGGRGWISRFRGGDCPGAELMSTVIHDQFSGQPCAGDHVRLINPGETIPGPICILGPFERYTEPARPKRHKG